MSGKTVADEIASLQQRVGALETNFNLVEGITDAASVAIQLQALATIVAMLIGVLRLKEILSEQEILKMGEALRPTLEEAGPKAYPLWQHIALLQRLMVENDTISH